MVLSTPFLFDEFFASGKEESISPFLSPSSRTWGKNLPLKTAIASAGFLLLAFLFSFYLPPISHLSLLIVYFLSGTPALLGAIDDMRNLDINIDVLMTLAALLSVIIGSGMEGALLLVLFEFSAAMENMVTEKTKGTLSHLNQLSPRVGCVISDDGTLFEKSVKEIGTKARLLVKAGELVPLDGTVVEGSSFVNLFHLTGESHPVPKKVHDDVPAGARNLDGTLTIEVTRTSTDSTLSRIITLITQAQEAKPRLQRVLDRFGRWYAMTIIGLFILFALTLPYFLSLPYFGPEGGIYRALAFLIAASPCALIIATPTAYLSAISSCARKGILLKGGVVLDALASCTKIAFDKTGTLTTGKLSLIEIEPICGNGRPETALGIAHALERNAVHPIADAINTYAALHKIRPYPIADFKSVPGFGLQASIETNGTFQHAYIGHADFISLHIPDKIRAQWTRLLTTLKKEGHLNTILLIGDDLFAFHFLDAVRPQTKEIVAELKSKLRLHPIMLTGDHPDIAAAIAKQVGIDEVYANLRPEDKLEKVSAFAEKGGLMMVGDGINDAPALARSTVGISMGKIGSATAVDASDVVFLNDDLSLLGWLNRKAHKTHAIVKQNITLALFVILFATTPALLGIVPLWVAVILHEGGTVLVGLNSLRLLRK
ncbi:MAG: cation-translocating P-type ATPase [Verrucomicrobia bacterium]|nr:cation-translocating P-type ATPase [Verrucomicrobiota bacterium]